MLKPKIRLPGKAVCHFLLYIYNHQDSMYEYFLAHLIDFLSIRCAIAVES